MGAMVSYGSTLKPACGWSSKRSIGYCSVRRNETEELSMKPWVHPAERRSRIYYLLQIAASAVAALLIPILLLQDPTQDHILIALVFTPIAILGVILGLKALKGLSKVYETEAD
jgi:hypothetical protein